MTHALARTHWGLKAFQMTHSTRLRRAGKFVASVLAYQLSINHFKVQIELMRNSACISNADYGLLKNSSINHREKKLQSQFVLDTPLLVFPLKIEEPSLVLAKMIIIPTIHHTL